MQDLSFDEKYEQLKRDSLYNGIFVTAVVTTGIFCRHSCGAKKPHKENVLFYDTPEEAIKNGFRPCKVCKPMNLDGLAPDYITQLIKELQQNVFNRITDKDLRSRGIELKKIKLFRMTVSIC